MGIERRLMEKMEKRPDSSDRTMGAAANDDGIDVDDAGVVKKLMMKTGGGVWVVVSEWVDDDDVAVEDRGT